MRLPQVGAAVLGVPVKPTIKEADAGGRVVKTLKRAQLWEVQTPQVTRLTPAPGCTAAQRDVVHVRQVCRIYGISIRCITPTSIGTMHMRRRVVSRRCGAHWLQVIRPKLLEAGFRLVALQHLEVTDDVSIIEAMHEPVQITNGSYTNIKVRCKKSVLISCHCVLNC